MVFDFERNMIRQQEIEVQALVAIVKYGNKAKQTVAQKKAFTKLYNIAFPELLTEKINQEKLEYQWFVKNVIREILLLVNYGKIDGLKNMANFVITAHLQKGGLNDL